MTVPSNPGWQYGYVPSPGEWNNTWSGKVDYPASVDQGGTGGQSAIEGNYNLQQRFEVITPTAIAAPTSFYSVRTDLTAATISIPAAVTCKAGDWIDIFDSGANASVNTISLLATSTDMISRNGTSATSLLLNDNGSRCILVTDGVGTWRAQVVTQSTGIGFAARSIINIAASLSVSQIHVGSLCKTSGLNTTITLPTTGFVEGNAITFDNTDATNTTYFTPGAGDFPVALLAGNCCTLVADGAGSWWKAAFSSGTSGGGSSQPVPKQIADTAYTLTLADAGQYLQFTSASPVTVTVPANAAVPYGLGIVVIIEQFGAGVVTLTPDTAVTLNGRNGKKTAGQFAVVQIKNGSNLLADTWTVLGDTAA